MSDNCGTAISAAPVGVGALKSATKSAIVKSISCPTALIVGTLHSYILKNPHQLLEKKGNKYLQLVSKLETLSPLLTLQRGYTMTKKEGKVITKSTDIKKKDIIAFFDSRNEDEIVCDYRKVKDIQCEEIVLEK